MSFLKCEKKTIFHVDYNDLDAFLSEVYDQPFEFVIDKEASNYSSYEFNIKSEAYDEYDLNELSDFRSGGANAVSGITRLLLVDCCNKGLIEPGTYIVKVFW